MKDHDLEMRFVFTEMPGAGADCVFVEVEDSTGASIKAGEWRQRDDGLVELVVLPKLITISGLRDDLDCQSDAGYTAVDMTTAAAEGFRDDVASVIVELPPMPTAQRSDEEATYSAGGCDMLRKCRAAIIAAGGKVKE